MTANIVSRAMSHIQPGPILSAARRPAGSPQQPDSGDRRALRAGLLLAIGGIWITVPLLDLVTGAPPPLPDLDTTGSVLLVAIGIGQALWGLDLLLRRKTLTIEQNRLQVSVRGLLGVRRWSEPLANYRGLRHCRERVRHRYGWRIVHRLHLVHPDPAKAIELVQTVREREIAAARRQWSEWLELPVWSGDEAAPRRAANAPEGRAAEPDGIATF
jgi:hypothetical protein